MKKIITLLTSVAITVLSSTSFADITLNQDPQNPANNGEDLVAKIVGVDYEVTNNPSEQAVLIMLKADDKLNKSARAGGTLTLTGKDLPFAMALASSVGKKVAVSTESGPAARVLIITDEYWNGSKK